MLHLQCSEFQEAVHGSPYFCHTIFQAALAAKHGVLCGHFGIDGVNGLPAQKYPTAAYAEDGLSGSLKGEMNGL